MGSSQAHSFFMKSLGLETPISASRIRLIVPSKIPSMDGMRLTQTLRGFHRGKKPYPAGNCLIKRTISRLSPSKVFHRANTMALSVEVQCRPAETALFSPSDKMPTPFDEFQSDLQIRAPDSVHDRTKGSFFLR